MSIVFECKDCGNSTTVPDTHVHEAMRLINSVCPGLPKKKVIKMVMARLKCPKCKPEQSNILVVR